MKTYARIESGLVAEIVTLSEDPAELFHPSLVWREVTTPGVVPGWLAGTTDADGVTLFSAPPPPIATPPITPSLAQLQSDLATLTAMIAAFTSHTGG